MSEELWATYSVEDHKDWKTNNSTARKLAADIMLFDRLVFPVPEDGSFPENTGPPDVPGPVQWTRNQDEYERWKKEKWDPDDQHELLDLLKPRARKVSWNSKRQREWRSEAAALAAEKLPDYAFHATRTVLTRDLPASVTGVAAVGPAYGTIEEIERKLGIRDASERTQVPGGALATVLGWEFLTPDDNQLSCEELLKETVAFVDGDKDFRLHRRAFIDWQQKFLKEGVTDRESIKLAVAAMHDLLDAEQAAAHNLKLKKGARYAFRLAPSAVAVGLPLVLGGPPLAIAAAVGVAFLAIGGIAVEEWFKPEKGKPDPTAFVHDVNHHHFGWKTPPGSNPSQPDWLMGVGLP